MATEALLKGKSRRGPKPVSRSLPGLLPAMQAKKLDDEALGRILGRSARAIQSWRLGNASPSMDQLKDMADALEVSVAELFQSASH